MRSTIPEEEESKQQVAEEQPQAKSWRKLLVGGVALGTLLVLAILTRGGIPGSTDGIFSGRELFLKPVDGRPFVDARGQKHQATALKKPENPAWSVANAPTGRSSSLAEDRILAEEWTRRALGEHASVPAFAAFTIALMSNNAPPKLVQDALVAAMDEVRHAKTSFEVASLLSGTVVEPGSMPPSKHDFGSDLTALGVAAAQEGCVDETLSALVAAYEAETHMDSIDRISASTKSLLKETLQTIALEETSHSALAWRTVQWVCSQDEQACLAVKREMFHHQNLERAFQARFRRYGLESHSVAMEAWSQVHSTLIPWVLSGSDTALEQDKAMTNCQTESSTMRHLKKAAIVSTSLMKEMADSIVYKTLCPS